MTAFHCDKLCGGACCEPLRHSLNSSVGVHGWSPRLDGPGEHDRFRERRLLSILELHNGMWRGVGKDLSRHSQAVAACRTEAWIAVHDPAKLAELLAMAGESRGGVILIFPYGARATVAPTLPDPAVIIYHDESQSGTIQIYPPHSNQGRILAMPQARALLRALVATPPDESSCDAVEALFRGYA